MTITESIAPPIYELDDVEGFMSALSLVFQSDISLSPPPNQRYYDKHVAMLIAYILTGTYPIREPVSKYAIEPSLNFWRICTPEMKDILRDIMTQWKKAAFKAEQPSVRP